MATDLFPSARVIADSVSPMGHRLTTMEVTLHRFVLAELNTHRCFSRSSASSRAIPVAKTMARLADQPAVPLAWPTEARGMQGGPPLTDIQQASARDVWFNARDSAVGAAEQLLVLGVHKSVVNRILEPFMSHTLVVSATDWDGFWQQRCSPLAQPEMRAAADAMQAAYHASLPYPVDFTEWHLPYIDQHDRTTLEPQQLRRVSVARCARVSYLTHTGQRSHEADLSLWDRLVTADPPHASPLEHVATPVNEHSQGNFRGWYQLRHKVLGF